MKKYIVFVLGCIASLQAFATPYSLEGYTIDAYMERTFDPSNFYPIGRIKGYGLDSPFEVHTGTDDEQQYSGNFKLNVDKDRFTIDYISSAGWADGIIFNLVQPDYATTTRENFWYGLGTDTNIEGIGVDLGYGWIKLDFSSTRFDENSYFIGYFNYQEYESDVPEPMPFILLGLCLIALSIRHRVFRKI